MHIYADDIVFITKRREILNKRIEEITSEGSKIGLKINENKTKIKSNQIWEKR